MQNVATGKSEVAALPLAFGSDSSNVLENSSEFRSLLQDASDKEYTQPIDPALPAAGATNQSSDDESTEDVDIAQVVKKPSENNADIEDVPVEKDPLETKKSDTESASIVELPSTITTENNTQESLNIDLATELEDVIPSIDLLDLLELSQFTQISISQGQKSADNHQLKNIQGLVEQLKTLSQKDKHSSSGDSVTVSTVLDKLISALEDLKIETEPPIVLTELIAKIQSNIRQEDNADVIPLAKNDENVELDIELLTVVIASEDSVEATPTLNSVPQKQDLVKDDDLPEQTTAKYVEPEMNYVANEVDLPPSIATEGEVEIATATEVEQLVNGETELQTGNEPDFVADVDIKTDIELNQEVATKAEDINVVIPSPESKDILPLLVLSPEKLDKALQNLASRIFKEDAAVDKIFESQTKIPSTAKQDFIASLKITISEIKSQLKQGKQIDLDLKSIATENLNRVFQDVNPDSLNLTISRFSQTLELSSTLLAHAAVNSSNNSANGLDSLTSNVSVERVLSKENQSQSNLLQLNQAKQQVIQFEKAVNVVRSEGQQQLVEKVRWMLNQNNLQAEIRLDPPELGAMKVRVSLNGETASVNIAVQSQQAKDLLDSAAPKLRDLLQEQGIQLGQSSVEQEQRNKEQNSSSSTGNNTELASEIEPTEENLVSEQVIANGRLSGIDYFV